MMVHEAVHTLAARRVGPAAGCAGDVTPDEAWRLLEEEGDADLVDVRTQPEWAFVGMPDPSKAGKQPLLVSWQTFPALNENPNFTADLAMPGAAPDQTVIFMCRSGYRSAAAAEAMTAKGFTCCFNLLDGFAWPIDGSKHRGTLRGWKAEGLPWVQGWAVLREGARYRRTDKAPSQPNHGPLCARGAFVGAVAAACRQI